MDKLIFTCDPNMESLADFYITYNSGCWDFNDLGHFIRYQLFATPKITPNKKRVLLGDIKILEKEQGWMKHNWLENRLRETEQFSLFLNLPDSFMSSIDEKTATMLWMLLDRKQREEFVEAMNLVLSFSGTYSSTYYFRDRKTPLFREGFDKAWYDYLYNVSEIMRCPIEFNIPKWIIMAPECFNKMYD